RAIEPLKREPGSVTSNLQIQYSDRCKTLKSLHY
ncbi:MAG: hypothetical protein ACI9VN_002490, partial [Patescibacteria group bacterium]